MIDSHDMKVVPVFLAAQKLQLLEAALKQRLADKLSEVAETTQFTYQTEIDENGVATIVGEPKEGSVVSLRDIKQIIDNI